MRKTIPVDKLLFKINRAMHQTREHAYRKNLSVDRIKGELIGYKTVKFMVQILAGMKF